MTTSSITSNPLYYQLSQGNQAPALPSRVPSLVDFLNEADATSANDSISLSPAAQNFLYGSQSDKPDPNASFTLTKEQQDMLTQILTKYKDAPYDQDTYDQIQSDLTAAGLSPDQLSAEDQIRSFNPTEVLMSIMDGKTPPPPAEVQQTKSSNYMQSILKQWQEISSAGGAA